jgi:predicted ATPase/class 3 adenylate cyclase
MDLPTPELPTGTVTFLFSDIESSTRLVEELDTPTFRELIEKHHALLREIFDENGGVERGSEGDGFLVVFADASSAVRAAIQAQRAIDAAEWPGGRSVRVRMGLHTGEGTRGGDDYVGSDIVRAARVAASAHGGQVLISDSTRALCHRGLPADVSVRFIGEHELKGLDTPERLYQLVIAGLPNDFPPPPTGGPGAAHVPTRMTSFVGREEELIRLRDLLEDRRLITLTGPGGTGKTSLAIELAREAASDFPDGAWFVDLTQVNDPALVDSTIASRLGLREEAHRSVFQVLTEHLESRRLMLVLDNFEHLLDASQVVSDLLGSAPHVNLVITSRSSLNLYGEQAFPVPPLALADPNALEDPEQIATGDAVSLFIERARTVSPDFEVSKDEVGVIARICARVDGLPLAIELAASRVRLLTPRQLLERLERHLPALGGSARDRPERQQTLSKTIQWSYDLLEGVEQELFSRVSIFSGGFTIEAAEAICDPDGELRINILEGLASLENQSLITQRPVAGSSRFEMLEMIREFGRDVLTSSGAFDDVAARHLEYYRGVAEEGRSHLMGPGQADWLDRLEVEHANLRQALHAAIRSSNSSDGLRLASSIWRFWFERGYLREGREWLERLLALDSDAITEHRASAYAALGGLAYWLSDPQTTEKAYEAALDIRRQIGDDAAVAEALYDHAFAAAMLNDKDEAQERFHRSMAAAERAGARSLIARNKVSLGLDALMEGDARTAISFLEEALETFRDMDDRFHITWAVGSLGQAYIDVGRLDQGKAAFLEALEISSELGNLPVISAGLRALAMQESALGHHLEAATLTGAVEALQVATGAQSPLPTVVSADLDAARRAMGEEAVSKALVEGRGMSTEEAVHYAIGVLKSL